MKNSFYNISLNQKKFQSLVAETHVNILLKLNYIIINFLIYKALSEDLFVRGVKNITSIDTSSSVINQMSQKI